MRRPLVCFAIACAVVPGQVAAAAGARSNGPDGATTTGSEPLELPEGVVVGVEFPRYLMVERRLEAIVDNQSPVAIVVIDVALRSPLFEPVAPDVHDYQVAAGLRQDLQMAVGASICPPADGPTLIEMTVEIDGVRRHGSVEIDVDPIAAINTTECGQRFVLERANVEFGPDFAVAADVMTTSVTLTRRDGDDPVAVTNVRGSVLFTIEPAGPLSPDASNDEPLGVMAAGASTASVPITIRAGRCEPHAVADAKKPYQFAVFVTVGDSEPYFLELAPDGDLRATLADLLQACIDADLTNQ